MMQQEFEQLIGFRVDTLYYAEIIEPMYMSICDHVTKQGFVKLLNKSQIKKIAGKEIGSILSVAVGKANQGYEVVYGIYKGRVFDKLLGRYEYELDVLSDSQLAEYEALGLRRFPKCLPFCDVYYGRDGLKLNNM